MKEKKTKENSKAKTIVYLHRKYRVKLNIIFQKKLKEKSFFH